MSMHQLTIDVFDAAAFVATAGVTVGEPMSFADELVMDDVYQLSDRAVLHPLALNSGADGLQRADPPHHDVHLDCCLTLMGKDGGTHDVLILVEVAAGTVAAIYLLPLGELIPNLEYRLVGIARHAATRRFAEAASGSFARGTHITMADGAQRTIETLRNGDLVLTRDAGKRPIRWIGQATLRATGSFAPVVISKGALNNENDLVLRPDHRLFVYQRADEIGVGRSEVLLKARHLVNGETVVRRRGGFVDYFQLIFDEHFIIYAEGIAAESHLVDPQTRAALPAEAGMLNHRHDLSRAYEVKDHLLPTADAARLLRKASAS
ncbi:Hint domain-containing protein [Cognatiyoonia sp. IB215182]|uniref:Hint domain-containing protein n=1 Tax=Cognatiyoonia sp. IB215182 TaxID=3097353 RepID=UPI002A24C080|nr:Hint domain-containing protein [Cognatiyoonia sp. IB215182]